MASSTPLPTVASLLQGLQYTSICSVSTRALDEQQITTVVVDSRHVNPGCLFIALPGVVCDGHDYIEAAVAGGASAIVCGNGRLDEARARGLESIVIEVENTAQAYAAISANFFHRPAEKLHFIGITGTNGKTTCTYLLEHVLLQAKVAVGVIGTVNNRYTNRQGEQKILPTRFTTPEAFRLQELLREMVDNGVDQVIMEVSSHALAQSRIGSISYDVAAFTNLSRDHLDYHTGMEDYFQAKARLFSEYMKKTGTAVLPQAHGSLEERKWLCLVQEICDKSCGKTIRWGEAEGAEVRLRSYSTTLEQTELVLTTASGRHTLSSLLVGRYNIDNVLTVYGLCLALSLDEDFLCRALATAVGAPGRLERVSIGSTRERKGPVVLVDYAHTPDALEKVLTTVAALPHNKLVCVFGCGGERDQGKRPLMGEIAGKICDFAVVTDDNPRTEDPDRIVAQILDGLRKTGLHQIELKNDVPVRLTSSESFGYVVIRDRQKAIDTAIRAASPGDIVVIAGKGHEPYQLTLRGKRFFDDRLAAKNVLLSWTTELVATATGGKLYPGKNPMDSAKLLGPVLTDSRLASRHGIFVALKGEIHDAHDFAWQAVENGAACLVVEKRLLFPAESAVCQIEVEDTSQALGDMAAFRRQELARQCDQIVIGLTGSCGKTTVKEMVAAILARMWPAGPDYPVDCVLKTKGNFNNLIGLPLSLLPLNVEHRAAVLEMGMNRPGELKRLGAIADPDISCITNIHGAHLEGLQSIEGVAKAKEELFAVTKESGILVVNLDDGRIHELSKKYMHRKITFAVHAAAASRQPDIWSSNMHMAEGGVITFTLHYRQEAAEIHLFIAGEHNVSNALCAAAIGLAAGASLQHIAAGLADFRPPDKRMEMLRGRSGFTVINDTYNANPASMTAGLKTLKMIAGRFSVAVIGDMRELGDASRQAHYDIGALIAELAIDCVGVVGEFKKDVAKGAVDHGFPEDRLFLFDDKKAAARWIHGLVDGKKLGEDDVLLVKASRGLRFETIVDEIIH